MSGTHLENQEDKSAYFGQDRQSDDEQNENFNYQNYKGSGLVTQSQFQAMNDAPGDSKATTNSFLANNPEHNQAAIEEFADHVQEHGEIFKNSILEKVNALKQKDTNLLKSKIEEMKSQESTELQGLNQIYNEKKQKARQLEAKVRFWISLTHVLFIV